MLTAEPVLLKGAFRDGVGADILRCAVAAFRSAQLSVSLHSILAFIPPTCAGTVGIIVSTRKPRSFCWWRHDVPVSRRKFRELWGTL